MALVMEPVKKFSFVPCIRGARNVQLLTPEAFQQRAQANRMKLDPGFTFQEYMKGDTSVRPFLDWDAKYKSISEGNFDEEKGRQLAAFKDTVTKLFPAATSVLYGQRHGVMGDPDDDTREYKYKISFRAWVLGIRTTVVDLPIYIRRVLCFGPKDVHPNLDLSVYKKKEQLLGVIYGCKDIDKVKRFLVPLPEFRTESLCNFLAQNVTDDDVPLIVPSGLPTGPASAAGTTTTTGAKKSEKKKKKVVDDVAAASTGNPSEDASPAAEFLTGPEYALVLQSSSKYFGRQYRLQEKLKIIKVNRDHKWLIFPTTEKWCFIKEDKHAGNNPYIVVTEHGSRWKCFDEECKKVEVKLIPFSELPVELRDLFTNIFYGGVDNNLMTEAKDECRKNITDNFPEEAHDELEVSQYRDMLTTLVKCQHCKRCKSGKMQTQHAVDGWQLVCNDCSHVWPTSPVTLRESDFPKLCAVLTQLTVKIGSITLNNTTNNISVTNILGTTGNDFYADFSGDNLVVFEADARLNELFIGSLQGTDTMLSRFATEHFKDRFHCTSQKKWYRFDTHCWSEDAADLAYKEAMGEDTFLNYYRNIALYFETLPLQTDDTKRKARMARKLCVQLEDGKQREKIVTDSIMKFHNRRPRFAELLNTQNIMVFEDGVFDFDSLTFGPGHPDVPVTMRVPQKFIPYDENNEHVRFLMSFMADLLPDQQVRDYTLKILGICLTMDTSQQYFFVWTGSGGNGKGRLLTLMEKCLGVYYQAIGPTFLTRKREDANQANEALMSLRTVRLAVFQEPEVSDVLQAGTIKSMTGEDTISTRENYGRQIKFTPSFKSLLVCNEIPKVSESTNALWRRFRVIHFPTSFVEEPTQPHERKVDLDLNRKLTEAAPYFIGILIHYFQRYKREGLYQPQAVVSATNKYKESVDIVKEFVDEHLHQTGNEESLIKWTELKAAFESVYKSSKLTRDVLREELKKHGVVYEDTKIDGKTFRGFRKWVLIK